jgi:predicted DNA-binding protein
MRETSCIRAVMRMDRLTITLKPSLRRRLEACAEADGRTLSGWVCRAIESAVAKVEIDASVVLSVADAGKLAIAGGVAGDAVEASVRPSDAN